MATDVGRGWSRRKAGAIAGTVSVLRRRDEFPRATQDLAPVLAWTIDSPSIAAISQSRRLLTNTSGPTAVYFLNNIGKSLRVADTIESNLRFLKPTKDIVASFVASHALTASEVVHLIHQVHDTLQRVAAGPVAMAAEPERPAVPIKKSIHTDYLICLNDGKRFKSLKRHLRTQYNMTPEDYRTKWGLDADYPMVAPGYARARSQMAKAMGLGQQRRRPR